MPMLSSSEKPSLRPHFSCIVLYLFIMQDDGTQLVNLYSCTIASLSEAPNIPVRPTQDIVLMSTLPLSVTFFFLSPLSTVNA